MAEHRPSLRRRLLALLLAATGVVWIAVAIAAFADSRRHTAELFDAQLEEYAEVLAAIGAHEAHEIEGTVTSLQHGSGPGVTYQVFQTDGRLLMVSHAAPAEPLTRGDGFGFAQSDGKQWRVLRRTLPATSLVVIVAQEMAARQALVRDLAWVLVLPILLGLPLMAAGVWLAVAKSLKPLDEVAAQVQRRASDRLDPVGDDHAPREVVPLVDALNALLGRVARSLENERRFTGDAAHELRTPLAALKTQAQVALTVASDERRRNALNLVVAGVDRASRLIDQLLSLARLDAAVAPTGAVIDLARAAREAAADFEAAARERGVQIELRCADGEPPRIVGDDQMLHLLLRNLIENALRHAPRGGRVRVEARLAEGSAVLTVSDSGPGVPAALRSRIFDRFFRGDYPGPEGSGLGLSIVQRVVDLHRGRIRAEPSAELGGLAMTATFPQAGKESLRRAA